MENVATYSEARSEYTKQLATLIVPALFTWFQTLWSRNAGDKQRCLALFQGECEEVGRWNQDRVNDEVRALIERSGCDYMEELMTAVFVAHTKVLTAVRLSMKQKKLSITVPKLDHFLHRIFKEAARCFWKTPYLFMDVAGTSNVVERQKNMLQAEQLLTESISTAVRGLLPVKQILKDYLEDDGEEVNEVVSTPVVVATTPSLSSPSPSPSSAAPAVVNIDTEPSVKFSEYDSVFDESKGAPEMVFNPKDGEYENENENDGPSDSAINIDESTTGPVTMDGIEDLEAPETKVEQKKVVDERIKDDDVVILE